MLDFVAKRYGLLPSQVMKLGDSVDVKCANLSVSYEAYLNKKHQQGWKDKSDHGYTQEQLQNMIKRVREHGNTNNQK